MVLEQQVDREMVPGLRREWIALVRRRWLIFSTTLIGLVGSSLYSFGVQPVYDSVATISASETMANQPAGRPMIMQRAQSVVEREATRLMGRDFGLRVLGTLSPAAVGELSRGPLGPWFERLVIDGLTGRATPAVAGNKVRLVSALQSRMAVQPRDQSSWIEVRITAFEPKAAVDLANAVVETYVAEIAEANRQTIEESKTALDQQLEQKQEQLGEQLDNLRTRSATSESGNIRARKANLERQVRAFQEALTSSQTALVGRAATAQAAVTGGDAGDPRVEAARDRVSDLEDRERALLANLGEQHPEVVTVREQLRSARDRLVTARERAEGAAKSAYQLALAEQRRIELSLARAQSELTELEKNSFDFTMEEKKAEAKRIAVDQIIQRQENTVPVILSAEIIQPAVYPGAPSSPRKRSNITYGLLGGLLAGFLLTWALDRFDDSVQSPEDIREILGLPFLGIVPLVSGLNPRINTALAEVTTGFSDGLRVVRTNLMYGAADSPRKVFVFTSASPAEGKSTIASGVATLLRETQARVLLIDGDLRRPSIHSLTELPESPGLSDLLAESGTATLKVTKSKVGDLDVVTAGPPLIASAARLGSERMRSLIEEARRTYDWIIVDSPPSLSLPDAAVLGTMADGVVIVCSGDRTPRQAVRSVADQMRAVGAPVSGVVLNRVDLRRHAYYYGRHYSPYYGSEARQEPGRKAKPGKAA